MAEFKVDKIKKGGLGAFSLIAGALADVLFFACLFGSFISQFLCCLSCLITPFLCLGWVLSGVSALGAIVMGIAALVSKKQKKGMAIGGIILGFLYFALWLILIIIVVIFGVIDALYKGF